MSKIPTKDEAINIFLKYNETDSLKKHALSVAAVMRHFAELFGEEADKWEVVGVLHDLDYEKYPDQHCIKVVEILKEHDVDESVIRAVVSHCWGILESGVKPEHIMEKVLFATDELTGLITAAALMRPSKSVMDLEYKSVIKKYKTPSFAAGVDRGVIEKGVEMLHQIHDYINLQYIIEQCILGMRKYAADIGLAGDGQ